MIDIVSRGGRQPEPQSEEEIKAESDELIERAASRAGRPTQYTRDKAAEIVERIVRGETLAEIVRTSDYLPNIVAIYYWMERFPAFGKAIGRARSLQGESWGEQAVSEVMREIPEDDIPRGKIMVQQQRTRADTLLKAAGRRDPERWGEKPAASAGVALQIVTNLGMSEDQPAGEMSVEAKPSSGSDDSKR